jgi:TonB family protein
VARSETVFRFDTGLKDRFPEFEDEQDVMKRYQEDDRRSLARSFGGAIPRGSTRSWVTDDDCPNTSVVRGAEGLLRVRVQVNSEGRAEECSILRSSGDVDLDAATCTNLIRCARFKPPHSNFEMQSTFEHNWRLPDENEEGRQGIGL